MPFSLLFLEIVKGCVFGRKMAPFQLNYWSGVLTRALLEYAAPYQLNLPEHFGLLCVLLLFLIFCYYKHKKITGCFAILYKQQSFVFLILFKGLFP